MPVIKQRQQAERLRNLWMNYMSVPLVIEQFMVWLDDYSSQVIVYSIKQTARKRAMLKGNMDLDYMLAYATKTMQNESARFEQKEKNMTTNKHDVTEAMQADFEARTPDDVFREKAQKLIDEHGPNPAQADVEAVVAE
jgi:hypothetical protein